MRLRRLALCLAVLALPTGCNKTFTGFNLGGAIREVAISGTLANVQDRPSILRVQLLLDGKEIPIKAAATTAVSRFAINGLQLGDHGRHTVVIVVAEQTSSPTDYQLSGLRVSLIDGGLDGSSRTVAQTTLPDKTQIPASGEGISYQFDL